MSDAKRRKKAVEMLSKALDGKDEYAKQLEEIVHSTSEAGNYAQRIRSLTFNSRTNPAFVLSNSPEDVAVMDSETLATGTELHTLLQDLQSVDHGMKNDGEGFLECRKCKGNDIEWYQLQTRGADEPMYVVFVSLFVARSDPVFVACARTSFCRCKDCGTRWKQ